jgi:paraquat-inducible protein A
VETVACPDCDLLQRIPPLPAGRKARCARCSKTIVTQRRDPLDLPLAFSIAAAIAFVVANVFPLMGLSAVGREALVACGLNAHERTISDTLHARN